MRAPVFWRSDGWPAQAAWHAFARTPDDICGHIWRELPDLMLRLELAFGNTRGAEVTTRHRAKERTPEVLGRVAELCPELCAFYRDFEAARQRTALATDA